MLSDAIASATWLTAFFACLNAPYGAPCFLTRLTLLPRREQGVGINAPYADPCFLTVLLIVMTGLTAFLVCLNAPYGAPSFLTSRTTPLQVDCCRALMHLMALRAF